MVYKPWQNDPNSSWGGTNVSNKAVRSKWKAFVSTLVEDIPDLLAQKLLALSCHTLQFKNNSCETDKGQDYVHNPDGSFVSDDDIPASAKQDLLLLDNDAAKMH